MKTRGRRVALIFLTVVVLAALALAGLTWRAVRQERLNQALIATVKRNDDRAVVALLDHGADANCRNEPPRRFSLWDVLMQVVRGRESQLSHAPTPLLVALTPRDLADLQFGIQTENLPLLRALLDHGARVNIADEYGGTPLYWAIMDGYNATVRQLLSCGANPNEKSLLAEAIPYRELDVIADLLDHGADVNQRDTNGDTPLLTAISWGRVAAVRILLDRHADVTQSCRGLTPLALAVEEGYPQARQIICLLKAAGAKP